jgi:hypothetical protein
MENIDQAKDKEVPVTRGELFMLAAEMVMENMPVTNKAFNPRDKDECIDQLEALIAKKYLTIEWIEGVASANISNIHAFIDCDINWVWIYTGGFSKATKTRKEFLDYMKEVSLKIKKGNIEMKDKMGKRYFKNGGKEINR